MRIGKREPRENEAKPEVPTNLISEDGYSWSRAAVVGPLPQEAFRNSLPVGPFVDHLMQLRTIFYAFTPYDTTPDALAVFDHSLTEIARFTAESPDSPQYPHKRGNW